MDKFPDELCSAHFDAIKGDRYSLMDKRERADVMRLRKEVTAKIKRRFISGFSDCEIHFPKDTSNTTKIVIMCELSTRFRAVQYWNVVEYGDYAEFDTFNPKKPVVSPTYRVLF